MSPRKRPTLAAPLFRRIPMDLAQNPARDGRRGHAAAHERRQHARDRGPDGRPMTEVAASFIAPNSRLTSFERLEIYNRQYWYRVLGALAEDFPALRALVGERRFEALSIAYLAEHPSRSFTLRNLGSKLPEWLAAHPEHTAAVTVLRSTWPDRVGVCRSLRCAGARPAHAAPDRCASRRVEARFAALPAVGCARATRQTTWCWSCTNAKNARPARRALHTKIQARSCGSEAALAAHVACRSSRRSVGLLPAHRARRISDPRALRDGSASAKRSRRDSPVRAFPAATSRARATMVWQLGRAGLDLRNLDLRRPGLNPRVPEDPSANPECGPASNDSPQSARSSMSALVRTATVAYGGMRAFLKKLRARCCSPSASIGDGSLQRMAGASCTTSIASANTLPRSTCPCRIKPLSLSRSSSLPAEFSSQSAWPRASPRWCSSSI
jgi:hypothetical protein